VRVLWFCGFVVLWRLEWVCLLGNDGVDPFFLFKEDKVIFIIN
jgi:hypothetical protein